MSDALVNRRRIAGWIAAVLLAPVATLAFVLLTIYVEETVFGTNRIESFFNGTPLGPPLSQIAEKIVDLFPSISMGE
jgi:hypothetical protein